MSTLDTKPQMPSVSAHNAGPGATKALAAKGDGRKAATPQELDEFADFAEFERLRGAAYAGQKRDQDRRYARFEERLTKEIGHLRSDFVARLETLERHLDGELSSLAARLQQEISDRQVAGKQLADAAYQAQTGFAMDVDGLRQATAKGERDLRQALLDAQKHLMLELSRMHDSMATNLAAEVEALEAAKVGRASLAALLTETVLQLNKEPTSSGGMLEL